MSGQVFAPGPQPNTVLSSDGEVIAVPADWTLVPPGDPALTRRIKAAGDHWMVQVKRGRRTLSRGLWTSAATVERLRGELEAERSTENYAKRRVADARRRESKQEGYVEEFFSAVVGYLAFHPRHEALGQRLARAITDHATPVGSGTVARTQRIPVEERVQAAVIAWMRHQTTAYDSMVIPRVKGKRREVRRMLAARSKALLEQYRGDAPTSVDCPLRTALDPPPSN